MKKKTLIAIAMLASFLATLLFCTVFFADLRGAPTSQDVATQVKNMLTYARLHAITQRTKVSVVFRQTEAAADIFVVHGTNEIQTTSLPSDWLFMQGGEPSTPANITFRYDGKSIGGDTLFTVASRRRASDVVVVHTDADAVRVEIRKKASNKPSEGTR